MNCKRFDIQSYFVETFHHQVSHLPAYAFATGYASH